MTSTEKFIRARDFLIRHREDYETAYEEFRWPDLAVRREMEFWEEDFPELK